VQKQAYKVEHTEHGDRVEAAAKGALSLPARAMPGTTTRREGMPHMDWLREEIRAYNSLAKYENAERLVGCSSSVERKDPISLDTS
jgi:hypothetical protein